MVLNHSGGWELNPGSAAESSKHSQGAGGGVGGSASGCLDWQQVPYLLSRLLGPEVIFFKWSSKLVILVKRGPRDIKRYFTFYIPDKE